MEEKNKDDNNVVKEKGTPKVPWLSSDTYADLRPMTFWEFFSCAPAMAQIMIAVGVFMLGFGAFMLFLVILSACLGGDPSGLANSVGMSLFWGGILLALPLIAWSNKRDEFYSEFEKRHGMTWEEFQPLLEEIKKQVEEEAKDKERREEEERIAAAKARAEEETKEFVATKIQEEITESILANFYGRE